MRSLPSSAERRLDNLRHRLVLDLYLQRGKFWDRVQEIRTRWDVAPERAVPPAKGGAEGPHLPASCPPRPDAEEIQVNPISEAEEAWGAFVMRWSIELFDLHDAVIPEDCRSHMLREHYWEGFLSTCVLFDPPVPGLERFAEAAAGPTSREGYPGEQRQGPRYGMQQSPIAQLRDAERAERATEDLYLGALGELIEKYLEPQGYDPRRVLNDVLFDSPKARERWEKRAAAFSDAENPVRPYIDVGPHTTEEDVRSAWRLLRAGQEGPAKIGRPRRGLLRDVECALLHQDGWTYERISERYGWTDHTRVSKYVRAGRQALAE